MEAYVSKVDGAIYPTGDFSAFSIASGGESFQKSYSK